MSMTLKEYRSKVLGCYIGKNIGGTLGAPFECKRGEFDAKFYTQDLNGEPLPNDDLDLQIVWLNAVEKYGKFINSKILGEYWHMAIIPNWGEYGAGKNNMRAGLVPPLSGYVNNEFRDSCGSFILSEIWACLCPGRPDIAVKYAYEDAIIDHSGEGLYAEVFCATLQAAAFCESDKFKLIDIALSYIPKDCGIATAVNNVINSYKSGISWKKARKKLLNEVPGSFGALGTLPEDMENDVPVGKMGYDAPSNIGIIIIGWLYGEDDFGESILIATNCGEDADCTAGTLGATLGIILGSENIPQMWKEPLGGKIKTLCINCADSIISVPKTVDEMADRIIKCTPLFLGSDICDFINASNGYDIKLPNKDALYNKPKRINAFCNDYFSEILNQSPFTVRYSNVLFDTLVDYTEEPYIRSDNAKKFIITVNNNIKVQQWLNFKWHLPQGFSVTPGNNISVSLEQYHCNIGKTKITFEINGSNLIENRYDLILEISSISHHTKELIPIVLLHNPIET